MASRLVNPKILCKENQEQTTNSKKGEVMLDPFACAIRYTVNFKKDSIGGHERASTVSIKARSPYVIYSHDEK